MAAQDKKKASVLILLLICLVLMAPLVVYICRFGFHPSANHVKWAEMGTTLSGMYTPILALLTLLVFFGQLRLQLEINTHQQDQAYIQQCREDINYFLDHLNSALAEVGPTGKTLKEMINESFQPFNVDDLKSSELKERAHALNQAYRRPFDIWSSIYPIIIGLRANRHQPYSMNAVGTVQRISTLISFETCVALDNYHWCITSGKTVPTYEFSPLLSTNNKSGNA